MRADRPLTHPPHTPLPPHPSKVGACIVSKRNEIIGVGYNGFPVGCSDDLLSWSRTGDPLDTKYLYVVHAEVNAVLNAGRGDVRGCRIYVALFPCNECAKVLIQAGICEVVYMDDKYRDEVRRARAAEAVALAGFLMFWPSSRMTASQDSAARASAWRRSWV